MLNSLKLWNFATGTLHGEEVSGRAFALKTCQRTLILSFEDLPFPSQNLHLGEEAYLFLLETICGLKSKLIGENEIVGQFKEAYQIFTASTLRDTRLQLILEKLFKDAKDIRTQFLIGISQKTYASLTRRHLIQRAKAKHVVVLGSGQLAEDLINQFKKKATVTLCARNSERVSELQKIHQISVIPWEDRKTLVDRPYIANTIGGDFTLLGEDFFELWCQNQTERLFVDLGSPSVIKTSLQLAEGVVRLDDIFNEGAIVESQKQQQIELARAAMHDITQKRKALFEVKFGRSHELLTPQITADVRYI